MEQLSRSVARSSTRWTWASDPVRNSTWTIERPDRGRHGRRRLRTSCPFRASEGGPAAMVFGQHDRSEPGVDRRLVFVLRLHRWDDVERVLAELRARLHRTDEDSRRRRSRSRACRNSAAPSSWRGQRWSTQGSPALSRSIRRAGRWSDERKPGTAWRQWKRCSGSTCGRSCRRSPAYLVIHAATNPAFRCRPASISPITSLARGGRG